MNILLPLVIIILAWAVFFVHDGIPELFTHIAVRVGLAPQVPLLPVS
jgi:hypothetical protein